MNLAFQINRIFQPGRKSLLLRSVIEEYSKKDEESETTEKEVLEKKVSAVNKTKSSSLKGKRKDLSMAMRKMIESEQDNVVKLYKQLKKDQRLQNKTQKIHE